MPLTFGHWPDRFIFLRMEVKISAGTWAQHLVIIMLSGLILKTPIMCLMGATEELLYHMTEEGAGTFSIIFLWRRHIMWAMICSIPIMFIQDSRTMRYGKDPLKGGQRQEQLVKTGQGCVTWLMGCMLLLTHLIIT